MISDTARFHGSFFVLLFEEMARPVSVERLIGFGTGYYLVGDTTPVYLKLSNKRKGPWSFNFLCSHQQAQQKLYSQYGECFTCLICGRDGIVGLCMEDLRQVLDGYFEEQENVIVRRKLKTMYQIKGRDGTLERRVSRHSIYKQLKAEIEKERIR